MTDVKEAIEGVLDQVRDFERKLGREQESLAYGYMLENQLMPSEVEIVREQMPFDQSGKMALKIYLQKRDHSRSLVQREHELGEARNLLRRALPKLMAHKRLCERNLAASNGGSWKEAVDYMKELIGDIEQSLGIKTFTGDDNGQPKH